MLAAVTGTGLAVRAARRDRLGTLLVLGYLAHVAIRLVLGLGRDGPTVFADETGYLVNARVLAGGTAGTLGDASFYRGGYSLLLVPADLLGGSPVADYRLALATNALLSALTFPLLHVLLTRVFAAPHAVLAAFLGALYPPLVVATQFASPESVLPVLVLAAAVALGAVARTGSAGWAAAAGACGGALYATHGRTVPVVAVLLVVLAALAVGGRPPPPLAGFAAAGLVALGGQLLNDRLRDRSWAGAPGDDGLDRVLANARDIRSAGSVGALGLGQYWYLYVATFGLAVLGLIQLATYLRRRSPETAVAVFLLGGALGLAVLVGLFLRFPTRADHVVYGRYVEVLVPPLLALGLVRLWTARPGRVLRESLAAAAVSLVAVLAVSLFAGGLVTRGTPVNWYNVLALPPLGQLRDHIRPLTATAVALAAAAALVAITRWRRAWGAAALAAAFLLMAGALRVVLVESRDDAVYGTQPGALSAVAGLAGATEVGYDMAAYTPVGLYGYQWELDGTRFVLFDSRRGPAPRTRWVIAGEDWPQGRSLGARRVWVHEAYGQAVWVLP